LANSAPLDQARMRRNVFGGYLSKAATLLIALIVTPVLLHYLGKERYGLWMAFAGIVAVAPIGDLGVGGAIVIRLAKALGTDDKSSAHRVVSTGFFLLLGISLLMVLTSLAVLPPLPWGDWFHLHTDLARSEAVPSILVLFLSLSLIVPLNIGIQMLNANQESFRNSLWLSAGCIVQIVAAFAAVRLHASLPWIIFTAAGLPGFLWIAMIVQEFGFRKAWLRPKWNLFDRGIAKELLALGWKILAGQTARTALLAVDAMVLAAVFEASAVAAFSIWTRLFFMAQVSQYAVNSWGPAFAACFERGDEPAALAYFRKVVGRYVLVTAALSLAVSGGIDFILRIWIRGGDPLPPPGLDVKIAFVVWTVTWSLVDALSAYATAGRHVKYQTFAYSIATVFVVIAKITLAKTVGQVGILWAFSGGMLLLYVLPLALRIGVVRSPAPEPAS
jgi:O-antigen/teichoic acid export membrane protein